MNKEKLSQLTDEGLLKTFEKNKPSPLIDAFIIGFLIGIIIFGVVVSAWGFTILIPLFLIYQFLKKPKKYEALRNEIKARGLE